MPEEWKGYQRIHIGNIRVIFWIDQEENTIYVDHEIEKEKIAGDEPGRLAQIINNANFGKINNLLSQGRDINYMH